MKKIVRRIIGKICHLFHVNVAKLFINRGKVLMLHWVGDEPLDDENEPFRISVAQCRKMLLWLQGNNVIFLYSGKIYPEKKVEQLIRAFIRTKNQDFRLIIIGVYTDDSSKQVIEPLISSDSRIIFMNFVSGNELTKYVCATDLYIQPGSISQTCQTAVCCGTPLCFNDVPTHREIYNGNGFFVDSEDDIFNVFQIVEKNPQMLNEMSIKSYLLAEQELDYHVIYNKILKAVGLDR